MHDSLTYHGNVHDAEHDDKLLSAVSEGFMNYYVFIIIAVFISGLDGRAYPGVPREEGGGERDEDRHDRGIGSPVLYLVVHGDS
ncbi:MAG: hypothetical protein ACLTZT_12800 [Butyricimonas faecalis]